MITLRSLPALPPRHPVPSPHPVRSPHVPTGGRRPVLPRWAAARLASHRRRSIGVRNVATSRRLAHAGRH